MVLHVVTYVTKPRGYFNELINNPYGVQVKVIGWGKKWNGFTDKIKGMQEFLKTLPNDDIVIFVDGYDTKILKPLDNIVRDFEEMNAPIVVSSENTGYRTFKIFSMCNDGSANSGMYMGYVKNLKELIDHELNINILNTNSSDQRLMNHSCKYVKIDVDRKLFFNKDKFDGNNKNITGYFISFPGYQIGNKKKTKFWFNYFIKSSIYFTIEYFLCINIIVWLYIKRS